MIKLLLYSTEPTDERLLYGLLLGAAEQLHETLRIQVCRTSKEFLDCGRSAPGCAMMFSARGPESVTLAAMVHEECPGNWLIWFSDLDFSLFAYYLGAAYFGLLPAQAAQIKDALKSCRQFTWERAPAGAGESRIREGPDAMQTAARLKRARMQKGGHWPANQLGGF